MLRRALLLSLFLTGFGMAGALPTMQQFQAAIRSDDLTSLRTLTASPGAAKVRGPLDASPLHYAALFGSADSVRILLQAGADPNVKNRIGDTPLTFAAFDFPKTRLLIAAGADVNAHSQFGQSPLMIAASVQRNAATVRYLVQKGVDPTWSTKYDSVLSRAAGQGDTETLRFLLAKGGDTKKADALGFTALLNTLAYADLERVNLLLKAGSNVNASNTFGGAVKNGPLALTGLTPLMLAVSNGSSEITAALLRAGAEVNAADGRKMTPVMLAVATDLANPATVDLLIQAGADVNAKDQNGESVLDWANKFRDPAILSRLQAAGAKGDKLAAAAPVRPPDGATPSIEEAVAKGTTLITTAVPVFFREGGCAGCHAQYAGGRVSAALSGAGKKDDELWKSFNDGLLSVRPRYAPTLPLLIPGGGDYDPILSALLAMEEKGQPANDTTDLYIHYLASRQDASGAWSLNGVTRPPMEESGISRTAGCLRVLKYYALPARKSEFDARVKRAVRWLNASQPATSLEHAERLIALQEAGGSSTTTARSLKALLQMQHADGGWAQTQWLDSDAYATGLVLHDLYLAGMLKTSDSEYRRGVDYLLRTQFPDGSWYVRSRAPKFQPYFQGGFPYDHDQWISSAATSYALMALGHAMKNGAQVNQLAMAAR